MQELKYTYHSTKLPNGNTIKYKEHYGVYYHEATPDRVVFLLHNARVNNTRLRIYYGDVKTGKEWGDVDTCYIGTSTGKIRIPLAIHNAKSFGGSALLDDCIVKIEYANKKNGGVMYQKQLSN